MLSETLETGLKAYRIGPKIRALRTKKKMGLVQLGEHTGLSAALLSKIERGQLFPTLPTLLRVALVFGVGLDHFFVEAGERPVAVVRRKDRLRLPDRPGAEEPSYHFESLDFPVTDRAMQAYYAEFHAPAEPQPHAHEGAETIYVISGTLVLNIDGDDTLLEAGDAVHFDSALPHSYRREGAAACTAVVVVAA